MECVQTTPSLPGWTRRGGSREDFEFEIILVYRVETLSQEMGSGDEKKIEMLKACWASVEPGISLPKGRFGIVPGSTTGMPFAIFCVAWCHICFSVTRKKT